jgi:lysyl-tRNA synthetase class 2
MIEWYRVGYDHHSLMSDVERLISAVLPASRQFDRAERLTYREAMQLHAGVDVFHDSTPMLVARLQSAGIEIPRELTQDRDACLDLIMGTLVGPQLGLDRLTFIYDYPASQAALARVQGPIASRFEAYMDGIELCNGFHELGDAQEQRARFASGRCAARASRLARGADRREFSGRPRARAAGVLRRGARLRPPRHVRRRRTAHR